MHSLCTSSPVSLCPLQRSFYRLWILSGPWMFKDHCFINAFHSSGKKFGTEASHCLLKKSLTDPFLSHVLALQNWISTKNIPHAKLVWSGIFFRDSSFRLPTLSNKLFYINHKNNPSRGQIYPSPMHWSLMMPYSEKRARKQQSVGWEKCFASPTHHKNNSSYVRKLS